MQAMRQISTGQRQLLTVLKDLLVTLCSTLEKRMIKQGVYCKEFFFFANYENGKSYKEHFRCESPLQDGTELLQLIHKRMEHFQQVNHCEPIINNHLTAMGITTSDFIPAEALQIDLFEDNIKKHHLRKSLFNIRSKYGHESIMKANELQEEKVMKDVIGFGSVKDMH
jgi:DNA polymerase-4